MSSSPWFVSWEHTWQQRTISENQRRIRPPERRSPAQETGLESSRVNVVGGAFTSTSLEVPTTTVMPGEQATFWVTFANYLATPVTAAVRLAVVGPVVAAGSGDDVAWASGAAFRSILCDRELYSLPRKDLSRAIPVPAGKRWLFPCPRAGTVLSGRAGFTLKAHRGAN